MSDADRYPTLTASGRETLRWMREHPNAPIYRNESGNRLRAQDVERLRALEREALEGTLTWQPNSPPPWVPDFLEQCARTVPGYRSYAGTARLTDLPTVGRGDFGRDIAQFVPDDIDVDRLINFRTSGTTGHPLLIASDPLVAAQYLGYHKRALRRVGIEPANGGGRMGIMLLGFQRVCFTYVSVTPAMKESGLAKINLHPGDWRHSDDRARYIDAMAPEFLAGDPLSWAELLRLDVMHRPRALLSTSMCLLPALRARLEQRFGCPVLDLYSLNEAGPVAVSTDGGDHVLLQHRMYVEILDAEGRPCASGARGEITLTGGFNFCLPLVRYRTGDEAALVRRGGELMLTGLSGRPCVRYRTTAGEWINNIEITHAMRGFPLAQFTLHQHAGGELTFEFQGGAVDPVRVDAALRACFGPSQRLAVMECALEGKRVQYTTDLAPPDA